LVYSEPNPGPLKWALNSWGITAGKCREPILEPDAPLAQALQQCLNPLANAERAIRSAAASGQEG